MRLRKVNSGYRGGDPRLDWREVGEGKVVTAGPDVSARRVQTVVGAQGASERRMPDTCAMCAARPTCQRGG